jgi:hypothetical protein
MYRLNIDCVLIYLYEYVSHEYSKLASKIEQHDTLFFLSN